MDTPDAVGLRTPVRKPPNAHVSGANLQFDIIVVGAGPTGLVAANVLACAGHSVALFERHVSPYNLPRAGHIDDDILRVLQDLDCLDPVLEDFFPFMNVPLLGSDGLPLFDLVHRRVSPSSFHSGSLYQPVLERALLQRLHGYGERVMLRQGWTVIDVTQTGASVSVLARQTDDVEDERASDSLFSCRYLVAADGAASVVRSVLGIPREDFGFNERWLDVDVAYRRPRDYGPATVFGDPARPHLAMPLGKRHHRFEWQLRPDEPSAAFAEPEKAWELLKDKGVTADDVDIVRQAPYTFEYRLAHRWRSSRIFLMGDAAHTMPPCLGQGMCSGIRDAVNLGWKLDLVMRGMAGESILESYQSERYPHVKAWSDLSMKAGEILCTTDPDRAAARDARFRGGELPAWRPPASLDCGLIDMAAGQPVGPAGQLLPQRRVRSQGVERLSDDVVGRTFALVARFEPWCFLSRADRAFADRIGMQCVWFGRGADDDAATFTDPTGEFEEFFARHEQAAMIVRPDHYVFGGVRQLEQLSGLISRLKGMLNSPSVLL